MKVIGIEIPRSQAAAFLRDMRKLGRIGRDAFGETGNRWYTQIGPNRNGCLQIVVRPNRNVTLYTTLWDSRSEVN